MSLHFDSVEQILSQLETQPGWEKLREYRQLLKCWSRVVNQQVALHTRPLCINRQILYVATSSSARAQELAFQRYTLLKRLNQQSDLAAEIKDIRFSSSQWHQESHSPLHQANLDIFTISDHQRRGKANLQQTGIDPDSAVALKQANETAKAGNLENNVSQALPPSEQAKKAAQSWLNSVEQKLITTPTCSKCNSVTSQAELNRWNSCHHCAAQKWSEEYRPPTFSEPE
jgi:predicted nucleic acid-binding Zn ribbon protein